MTDLQKNKSSQCVKRTLAMHKSVMPWASHKAR